MLIKLNFNSENRLFNSFTGFAAVLTEFYFHLMFNHFTIVADMSSINFGDGDKNEDVQILKINVKMRKKNIYTKVASRYE